MSYTYEFPRASLTVDCIVVRQAFPMRILLIRRKDDPYGGCWAFPGGYVEVSDESEQGESLEAAARRELWEETGIKNLLSIRQLVSFGEPGRDPRGRVVSTPFLIAVDESEAEKVSAGSDAADVGWFDIDELPTLAFDHEKILAHEFDSPAPAFTKETA